MSTDLLKPKIDLKQQPSVSCEKCGSIYFREVVGIKRVSKILTGSSQDTDVPFPTYKCDNCGHINKEYDIFNNLEEETNYEL
jgi:predicted nucleic acid-binding Zn ribbon protein